MIFHFLKSSFRRIYRDGVFTLIKILGFTFGITVAVFILAWILDETSYDRFHQDANRIYRLYLKEKNTGEPENHFFLTPPPLSLKLQEDYPEIEAAARIYSYTIFQQNLIARIGELSFFETEVIFTEPSFFKVFDFKLLQGDPEKALEEPNAVVLTQSTADRYFPDANPLGKILELRGKPHQVTGIVSDPPRNSHFHFRMLISAASLGAFRSDNWNMPAFLCYLKLKPEAEPKNFIEKLAGFYEKYQGDAFTGAGQQSYQDFVASGNQLNYELEPLISIHLHSQGTPQLEANGNQDYVVIFSVILIMILVVSGINYMNLTQAQFTQRAREIGVHKSFGAAKRTLLQGFLLDAMLITLLAFLLALILVNLLLPEFNRISGKTIDWEWLINPSHGFIIISIVIITGLLSGLIPAFQLIRVKPVLILKGQIKPGKSTVRTMNGMLITQYVCAIGLLLAVLVIRKQMHYLQEKDLGFNQERLLTLENPFNVLGNNTEAFKEALLGINGVTEVSFSSSAPPRFLSSMPLTPEGLENPVNCWQIRTDPNFLSTYEIRLLQGRNFSETPGADSAAIILNEAAVRAMGWSDPLGKKLYNHHPFLKIPEFTVVGVIQDFHFSSLRDEVEPLSLLKLPANQVINLRLAGNQPLKTVESVERNWKTFTNSAPFQYAFTDVQFDALFRSEKQLEQVVGIFTFLMILISALGLFGLTAYRTRLRLKEFGIRKVLGAGKIALLQTLARDFTWQIGLSSVLAVPLSSFLVHKWLNEFAFRTNIGWIEVLGPIAGTLMIAWIIGYFFAWKASRMNPVETLRTE